MRGMHRWMAAGTLLGMAACVTDGPLAPRIAPGPETQRLEANAASTAGGASGRSVLLRGKQRRTGPFRPVTYVVDGRVMPADSLRYVDPASIIGIEVVNGLDEAAIVHPRAPHVVFIRTRAGG